MRKYNLILFVLFCFCPSICGQSEGDTAASSNRTLLELVKVTSQIYDAYIRRDRTALDRRLAENFLETDAACKLRDKTWNLENLLGIDETLSYQIEEPQVREQRNVAILFYKWNVEHGIKGKVGRSVLRVTDVFIKTDNGWKVLTSHRTKLNDKQDLENQLTNGIRCEAR